MSNVTGARAVLRIGAWFGLIPPAGVVIVGALTSGSLTGVLRHLGGIVTAAAIIAVALVLAGLVTLWRLLRHPSTCEVISGRADITAALDTYARPAALAAARNRLEIGAARNHDAQGRR
jgi:hypothetical protein